MAEPAQNRDNFEFVKAEPPHDRTEWVKIDAHIRDNATGEIRIYHSQEPFWDEHLWKGWNQFWWEEGNGSCDCNRTSMFRWAVNVVEPEDEELSCTDGHYSVRIYSSKGVLLYDEFEEVGNEQG